MSLQGETKTVGLPTVFVRLTGCPLRCQYCDSAYAFSGGKKYSEQEVLAIIAGFGVARVTVTGGEPLAQPACISLLDRLCEQGYDVSLETSGALSIEKVNQKVMKVVDFKTPGSGELTRNLYQNISFINWHDQIKFVICDRGDYEWAKGLMAEYDLPKKCEVLLSASYKQLPEAELANWIVEDRLTVRFQIQLHKYLWGDLPGK